MKTLFKIQVVLFSSLIMLSATIKSNGQIDILHTKYIPGLAESTLYIDMPLPTSPKEKAYVDMFKKYWTYSKVECFKHSEAAKYDNIKGNYVLQITEITSSSTNHTDKDIYLSIVFFKARTDMEEIAEIYINPQDQIPNDPMSFVYDGSAPGAWGAGIFKNYIQQIQAYFKAGQDVKADNMIFNEAELAKLKSSPLIIPEYVLQTTDYAHASKVEAPKIAAKLLEKYPLEYKIVNTKELNNTILSDTSTFYYLVFLPGHRYAAYISIINSSTGEVVYNDAKSIDPDKFTPRDLKTLISKLNSL